MYATIITCVTPKLKDVGGVMNVIIVIIVC